MLTGAPLPLTSATQSLFASPCGVTASVLPPGQGKPQDSCWEGQRQRRAVGTQHYSHLHVLTSSVLGSPWAAPAALPWPHDCYSPVPCPCPHLRTGPHGLGRADIHPREDAEGAPTLQSSQKVGYRSQDSTAVNTWRGTSVFTHTHTVTHTRVHTGNTLGRKQKTKGRGWG